MPTPGVRCGISTAASEPPFCSSHPADRPTKSPICRSCGSPWASPTWTPRPSTTSPSRSRTAPTSCGASPRLYPGALVWCLKKPGRDLREKVELALAWKRVAREVADGTLSGEFDRADRADLQSKVKDAEEATKDEVWGDYRFAVLAD